jgi:hypothetical protein
MIKQRGKKLINLHFYPHTNTYQLFIYTYTFDTKTKQNGYDVTGFDCVMTSQNIYEIALPIIETNKDKDITITINNETVTAASIYKDYLINYIGVTK